MALLDHFANDAGTETGENGFERLPAHQFTDSLFLWAIGDVTRTQVVNAWSLDATDQVQLDEMAANYVALVGKDNKNEYINKLEAVLRLYEYGTINETQAKGFIGLA